MDKLIGEATLSVVFMSPSKKGSSLKEKNLLSLEANSFHLELPFISKISLCIHIAIISLPVYE